jgi:hypothetical protein
VGGRARARGRQTAPQSAHMRARVRTDGTHTTHSCTHSFTHTRVSTGVSTGVSTDATAALRTYTEADTGSGPGHGRALLPAVLHGVGLQLRLSQRQLENVHAFLAVVHRHGSRSSGHAAPILQGRLQAHADASNGCPCTQNKRCGHVFSSTPQTTKARQGMTTGGDPVPVQRKHTARRNAHRPTLRFAPSDAPPTSRAVDHTHTTAALTASAAASSTSASTCFHMRTTSGVGLE